MLMMLNDADADVDDEEDDDDNDDNDDNDDDDDKDDAVEKNTIFIYNIICINSTVTSYRSSTLNSVYIIITSFSSFSSS